MRKTLHKWWRACTHLVQYPLPVSRKTKSRKPRSLFIEDLERRQLLSVAPPVGLVQPVVTSPANLSAAGQETTLTAGLPASATHNVSLLGNGATIADTRSAALQSGTDEALQFDGSTNYIDLGNTLAFSNTSSFSVSFWMQSTNYNQQMIIGKGEGFLDHDSPGWTVFTAYGHLYFQLNAANEFQGNELQAYSNTPVCDGQWHNIVVTYDGTDNSNGVAFYIDGTAQSLGTDSDDLSATFTNTVDATIGATPDGQGFYCGALAEMDVFNATIASPDVTTLYGNGAGDYGAERVSGLIAGYHLDDASGVVTDYSATDGNGNNGILYGDASLSPGPISIGVGAATSTTVVSSSLAPSAGTATSRAARRQPSIRR